MEITRDFKLILSPEEVKEFNLKENPGYKLITYIQNTEVTLVDLKYIFKDERNDFFKVSINQKGNKGVYRIERLNSLLFKFKNRIKEIYNGT